jgi:hypothetical protein
MHLVSRNDPASMGAIVGRPTVLPPSFALGDNRNNELFACALHGKGSDALRVALFQHSAGAGIERVLLGPKTGDIEGSTAAALTKDWLVTAIHGEGSGRLKVMSWRVTSAKIERRADSGNQIGTPGGTADLAYVGGTKMALAVKTSDGKLKVIVLNVNPTSGSITRHDGDAAGRIINNPSIAFAGPLNTSNGLPTPAAPGSTIVTTAIQSSTGRLKLINWEIEGINVRRRGDTGNNGPKIHGRPALAGAPNDQRVICAYHADGGELRVAVYDVGSNGEIESRGSRSLQNIVMTNSPSIAFGLGDAGGGQFATAITLSNSRLRADRWLISDTGSLSHHAGQTVNDISCAGSPSISPMVIGAAAGLPRGYVVAVREAGTNKLSLTKWA